MSCWQNKQRQSILLYKNMHIFKRLLHVVSARIKELVVSRYKVLYSFFKEVCRLWFQSRFFLRNVDKLRGDILNERHGMLTYGDNWASAYSCSHSNTAAAFQLGVVWLNVYLPEEQGGITELQKWLGVDGASLAKLTGDRLLWRRYAQLVPW